MVNLKSYPSSLKLSCTVLLLVESSDHMLETSSPLCKLEEEQDCGTVAILWLGSDSLQFQSSVYCTDLV